jgi:hypothetical protein
LFQAREETTLPQTSRKEGKKGTDRVGQHSRNGEACNSPYIFWGIEER